MSYWVVVVMMCFLVSSFLLTRITIGGVPTLFTKTMASLGFVFSGLVALIYTEFLNYYTFILVGLILGMIGDILLDLKRQYPQDKAVYLNYGMLSFGLGHIMYFMALGNSYGYTSNFIGKTFIALAVALAAAAVIVFVLAKPLKLEFGEFKIQSFAYATVLIFVMVLSLLLSLQNNKMWLMTAGLIAFLASDLVLSTQYFGNKEENKILIIINHVLYYGAQVLIVGEMFF